MAGKYEKDAARVAELIRKGAENLTQAERLELLQIYRVSWHDSGKIQGAFSLDSSCHGCTFCQKMRAAAEKDPAIICGKCYDHKLENLRPAMRKRHELNLRIMSTIDFTVAELATLPGGYIVRINSSGDIENEIHAGNMIKYAIAHPFSNVGLWAKNDPAVQAAFAKYGKPANLVYVASVCRINGRRALPKNADYTFGVYTDDIIGDVIASGACECNGKKCLDCGFKCYLRIWPQGSNVAEVLR